MHLIVFDIDGTLTDTNALDEECVWQATREVLGLPKNHPRWLEVKHYTDIGIASQHCEAAFGRDITRSEIELFRGRLMAILEAAVAARAQPICAMPGAAEVLAGIRAISEFESAIATGCFLASAELKLRETGLFDASIPIEGCDDNPSREEIMLSAARKAAARRGGEFSAVTYVGDGVWDVRAAKKLGWNFIGIGAGDAAVRLREAGAEKVVPDFKPATRFLDLLGEIPSRA